MKDFMDEQFLLQTETAQILYHTYAANLPIVDYHCHLDPKDIASDRSFGNLTEIWLKGDHYKWRALRANGINEKYITGNASDEEKFQMWAKTVPYCLRNPLYHWTHLELKRPFNIHKLLNEKTAAEIYDDATRKLQTRAFSARNIMREWKVEVVCTTDDPIDTLEYHKQLRDEHFEIKVLPTWRPDKILSVEAPDFYNAYLDKLELLTGVKIFVFSHLIEALKIRQQYFVEMGCKLSDHGLDRFYADAYTEEDINQIFAKIRVGDVLDSTEIAKYKSAMLVELAILNHSAGWVQQFHYGPLRNTNSKMYNQLGPDAGYDTMGDVSTAKELAIYLNRLENLGCLAKTIIYNINPKENDMIATMIANFQDGSVPGKIQFGAAWWFLDQKQGIESHINSLSNHGLLSRFVGMLTDSRSFLSYSRHEYFRRILCNIIGNDVEQGLIPHDMDLLGSLVQNICYYNARAYFNF